MKRRKCAFLLFHLQRKDREGAGEREKGLFLRLLKTQKKKKGEVS